MEPTNPNATKTILDQWELHKELGKEYARQRERRGGKSLSRLIAEANAPWFILPDRRRRPGCRSLSGQRGRRGKGWKP